MLSSTSMQRIESTGFFGPFFFASAAFSGALTGAPRPGRSGITDPGDGGGGGATGSGACCAPAAAAREPKSRPAGTATDAGALGATDGGAIEGAEGATDGGEGVGGT
jgi:hypothetical protein